MICGWNSSRVFCSALSSKTVAYQPPSLSDPSPREEEDDEHVEHVELLGTRMVDHGVGWATGSDYDEAERSIGILMKQACQRPWHRVA
jgi:hypothetical protein